MKVYLGLSAHIYFKGLRSPTIAMELIKMCRDSLLDPGIGSAQVEAVFVARDDDIIASDADLRGLVLLVAQKADCVQSYLKLWARANEGTPNWLGLRNMEENLLSYIHSLECRMHKR